MFRVRLTSESLSIIQVQVITLSVSPDGNFWVACQPRPDFFLESAIDSMTPCRCLKGCAGVECVDESQDIRRRCALVATERNLREKMIDQGL